jgi:hypothetical protein
MRAPMLQRTQRKRSSKHKLAARKTTRKYLAIDEIAYTVSYIEEMTQGLLPFSKISNFELISYLLELARCEANYYLRNSIESSSVS